MFERNLAAVALSVLVFASPVFASTMQFHAAMTPASEVPPVDGSGAGTADATLDTVTHKLTYDLVFSGFSGPVTMAHFHGPAQAGSNAGVVVPLGNNPVSPLHGTVTLTDAQQSQLVAGEWYANVHTAQHPKGAARGQMVAK